MCQVNIVQILCKKNVYQKTKLSSPKFKIVDMILKRVTETQNSL